VYYFNEEPHFKEVSTSKQKHQQSITVTSQLLKLIILPMAQGPTVMWKAGIHG